MTVISDLDQNKIWYIQDLNKMDVCTQGTTIKKNQQGKYKHFLNNKIENKAIKGFFNRKLGVGKLHINWLS